jgi:hypothetical protein
MGANSQVFLRMSEEHYMTIPNEIRECFLSSKRVDEDVSDFKINIQDPTFEKLYNNVKKAKENLSEYQYILREERRKLK